MALRGLCVAALLLLAANSALAQSAETYATYPTLNAALVAAGTSKNLTGACICDQTPSTCDPNCCCDTDCSAALVSTFTAAGTCLPSGGPPAQLTYCTSNDQFATVNLPAGDYYRMPKKEAGQDFLTELLCIVSDRNPGLGDSYPNPAAGDVGTNKALAACPAAAAYTAPTAYASGVAVVAQHPVAGDALVAGKRNFTLPFAGTSAECSDSLQLAFLQPVPISGNKARTSTCLRPVAAAAACAADGQMDMNYYTRWQFAATPGSATLIPVTGATTVSYLNPTTGVYSTIAASAPAVCDKVVKDVVYTFYYDAGMAITKVEADILLTAVTAAAGVHLSQGFRVQWLPSSATARPQVFSGNPGYLPGYPVLGGTLAGSGGIDRYASGLPLPLPSATGACATGSSGSMGFGFNTTSTCWNSFAQRSALATACTATFKPVDAVMGALRASLVAGTVYVGQWGNSDMNDVTQWLKVDASAITSASLTPSWDATNGVCHNVASGVTFRFVTSVAYSSANLQSKILYATACYSYSSWRWENPAVQTAAAQRFPVTFAAEFVPKAPSGLIAESKPSPPLFVPISPDIWYPFVKSTQG